VDASSTAGQVKERRNQGGGAGYERPPAVHHENEPRLVVCFGQDGEKGPGGTQKMGGATGTSRKRTTTKVVVRFLDPSALPH
jgi:hypothetical protein